MKKVNFLFVFSIILSMVVTSCSKLEDDQINSDETVNQTEVPKNILEKLQSSYFDTRGAFITTYRGKEVVAVEDLFLTFDQINELEFSANQGKQYRTNNLVTIPEGANERAIIVNITGRGLGQITSNALNDALAMYNNLDLTLTFRRPRAGENIDLDIEVTSFFEAVDADGFLTLGRAAGFPDDNGDPADSFGLNTNWVNNFNPSRAELAQTIAHEIGHAIGLRHTDFATRESCGQNINEDDFTRVGSVHIAGTPMNSDTTSLMQACASANNRIFNANDELALETIY